MAKNQTCLPTQDDLRCKLYRLLLQKYADLINDKEKRTIGEIKGLVNADDLTIQSIVADHKPENYKFAEHYIETAEKIFEFIHREINYVNSDLNLNYWLAPKEILSEKFGDDEDLAVFLCSLLFALGDENSSIVIAELDNLQTHAFVVTEIDEKFLLLDPSQKHVFDEFKSSKEDVLQKYSFNGAKIKRFLYKFNHFNYEQFIE